MRILITGATGFIGAHLARVLYLAGHQVRCAVRNPERAKKSLAHSELITLAFGEMKSASDWLPHLLDMDAVVNAVGIFEEKGNATFSIVHTVVPTALFEACKTAGIKRIVQISALGANINADTEFLRSKARADNFLLQKNPQALVLQPSLVFGEGGTSSELFVQLALFPISILPDSGSQIVQPVNIDDIVSAALCYLEDPVFVNRRIAAVGAEALPVREYMQMLRHSLGYADAHIIGVKTETLTRLFGWLRISWLSADALRMLQQGNRADSKDFAMLLQREPLAPKDFAQAAIKIRNEILLRGGFRVLRYSIAMLWILTGIVSLGVYPVESSKLLLARVGIEPQWQAPLLYGASVLDIALGIAIIFVGKWRLFWLAQIFTIVFYSVIIAWKLPEFWLHPYAPMLKNIPLLAAIYLIMRWEKQCVRAR